MSSVPVSDRTLVVQVDEILQAPQGLEGYLGHEITVQLTGRRKVPAEGQEAIFYTNAWLFGESIAVQAIGYQDVARRRELMLSQASGPTGTPGENLANRDLQKRVAGATTVVAGRVTEVRLPRTVATRAATLTAAVDEESVPQAPIRPLREHDGDWREAVIQVEQVEKGSVQVNNVVVLFPSSRDVRWYRAPKFEAGQEGVFILNQRPVEPMMSGLEAAADAGAPAEEVYTALDPIDFQPLQQLPVVRTLVATTQGQSPNP